MSKTNLKRDYLGYKARMRDSLSNLDNLFGQKSKVFQPSES